MTVGIIGGSGFASIPCLSQVDAVDINTPYGKPSDNLILGEIQDIEIVYLARHGEDHTIPPHKINYRANIWALKQLGVRSILALTTVGGISSDTYPGALVVPDQILDYTYGREHTFFNGEGTQVKHIDMLEPYNPELRQQILQGSEITGIDVVDTGTYAATQGPRFETPAEICRMERDGATIVGMTGMPEAVLAKELGIAYAAISLVVNPAAGKSGREISFSEVEQALSIGKEKIISLLGVVIPQLKGQVFSVPEPISL